LQRTKKKSKTIYKYTTPSNRVTDIQDSFHSSAESLVAVVVVVHQQRQKLERLHTDLRTASSGLPLDDQNQALES